MIYSIHILVSMLRAIDKHELKSEKAENQQFVNGFNAGRRSAIVSAIKFIEGGMKQVLRRICLECGCEDESKLIGNEGALFCKNCIEINKEEKDAYLEGTLK